MDIGLRSSISGYVTARRTLEDAGMLAGETLTLHMAGMAEDGAAIPEPSTLDQLAGEQAMKGLVSCKRSGKGIMAK